MIDEVAGTAAHEAGHAAMLHKLGVPVAQVRVTSETEGSTEYDEAAFGSLPDEDAVQVALVGMYAESALSPEYSVGAAIDILLGASEDMRLIYRRFTTYWLAKHSGNWYQMTRNRAEKFVQDNGDNLEAIARDLLIQKGFPKELSGDQVRSILG